MDNINFIKYINLGDSKEYNLGFNFYFKKEYLQAYELFLKIKDNPEFSKSDRSRAMFMIADILYFNRIPEKYIEHRFSVAFSFYVKALEDTEMSDEIKALIKYRMGSILYDNKIDSSNDFCGNIYSAHSCFDEVVHMKNASKDLRVRALFKIANILLNKDGFILNNSMENKRKALRLFRNISNMVDINPNIVAMAKIKIALIILNYGVILEGDRFKGNIDEAFKLYLSVLNDKDIPLDIKAQAEYGVGNMFYNGQIGKANGGFDYESALEYFTAAEEHGFFISDSLRCSLNVKIRKHKIEKENIRRNLFNTLPVLEQTDENIRPRFASYSEIEEKRSRTRTALPNLDIKD